METPLKINNCAEDTRSLVLRFDISPNRTGVQAEVLRSVANYAQALEIFNRMIVEAVDPRAIYALNFNKVSEGSVKNHLKEFYQNHLLPRINGDHFISKITADRTIDSREKLDEVKNLLEKTIEDETHEQCDIPIEQLTQVFELLSEANESTYNDESIELTEYLTDEDEANDRATNIITFDRNFRSTVKVKDVEKETVFYHDTTDTVKVIKLCNFGTGQWTFKSLKNNDTYSATIEHAAWLHSYQIGEIPAINALHTLTVESYYEKHCTSSKTTIKCGKIRKVISIEEDDNFEQIEIE